MYVFQKEGCCRSATRRRGRERSPASNYKALRGVGVAPIKGPESGTEKKTAIRRYQALNKRRKKSANVIEYAFVFVVEKGRKEGGLINSGF